MRKHEKARIESKTGREITTCINYFNNVDVSGLVPKLETVLKLCYMFLLSARVTWVASSVNVSIFCGVNKLS